MSRLLRRLLISKYDDCGYDRNDRALADSAAKCRAICQRQFWSRVIV